jgi:hypothetical protein
MEIAPMISKIALDDSNRNNTATNFGHENSPNGNRMDESGKPQRH